MLKYGIIICASLVAAVGAAQAVVSLDRARFGPPPSQVASAVAPVSTPVQAPAAVAAHDEQYASPGRSARIKKASDGHFWADAQVNRRKVRFLVDTGATAVALSPEDARRLGFPPGRLDYGHTVMTAGGEARAARITLESIDVDGVKVENVEAFVIEKGLDTSLLGMTYLGRLEKFQATRTALVLTP